MRVFIIQKHTKHKYGQVNTIIIGSFDWQRPHQHHSHTHTNTLTLWSNLLFYFLFLLTKWLNKWLKQFTYGSFYNQIAKKKVVHCFHCWWFWFIYIECYFRLIELEKQNRLVQQKKTGKRKNSQENMHEQNENRKLIWPQINNESRMQSNNRITFCVTKLIN